MQARWESTEEVITTRFVPLFDRFLSIVLGESSDGDIGILGNTLLAMHTFFEQYDYQVTVTSRPVWRCFHQRVAENWPSWPEGGRGTIDELTEALRLLFRFLQVLQFPVLPTTLTHSTAAAFCGLPCIIAKLKFGTPFLLTEHGVYLREQYLNLRRYVHSAVVRGFLHRLCAAVARANYLFADQISPVCAHNVRWERWWGADLNRVRVIYNGCDPAVFRPEERPSPQPRVVVCMGLLFPLKGQRQLIETAKVVKATHPDVQFRLYGQVSDQEYFAECELAVRTLHLEDTVTFAGSTSEPWHVYNDATVVASASLSEGHPYAIIEAMLCGRPIVATSVGGVAEALGDCGVLVQANCPDEMAAAITNLLAAPGERARLGQAARARALQHFTQEIFVAEYRESYQRLGQLSGHNMPRLVAGNSAR